MREEKITDEQAEYLAASTGSQAEGILADVAARPRPPADWHSCRGQDAGRRFQTDAKT